MSFVDVRSLAGGSRAPRGIAELSFYVGSLVLDALCTVLLDKSVPRMSPLDRDEASLSLCSLRLTSSIAPLVFRKITVRKSLTCLPLLAIAALALASCTSTEFEQVRASTTAVEPAPGQQETSELPALAEPTASKAPEDYSDKELQDWADEKMQQWMDEINEGWEDVVMDIYEPEDFLKWYPTDPHGHMLPFEAPEYGELLITLEPYEWEVDARSDLAYVGSNTMLRVGEQDKNLRSVTVVTQDGEFKYVATREDWPPFES